MVMNIKKLPSVVDMYQAARAVPPVYAHAQDPSMWATLASMAMAHKELNTAEVAFAEVDEVDKLRFVVKVGWHSVLQRAC
jgi:cytochrome c-type biogenesis protein CcmH/NrfG